MSWLSTPIPLYQLLVLITIYVIYKELVKIGLKSLVKLLQRRKKNGTKVLAVSENFDPPQLAASRMQ